MPRIFVSTQKKPNKGDWIDLDEYSDEDSFYERAREIHSKEDNPEFIFQDWEDIPEGLISKTEIDGMLWEWMKLEDEEKDIIREYLEEIGSFNDVSDILSNYEGKYNSMEEFAEQLIYDLFGDEFRQYYSIYFDFDSFARDLENDYDITKSGYIFKK